MESDGTIAEVAGQSLSQILNGFLDDAIKKNKVTEEVRTLLCVMCDLNYLEKKRNTGH